MSKQPPPAPTANAVGPYPTVIQIVGRPGTGSLPSTFAPPDRWRWSKKTFFTMNPKKIFFRGLGGGGEAGWRGDRVSEFSLQRIRI